MPLEKEKTIHPGIFKLHCPRLAGVLYRHKPSAVVMDGETTIRGNIFSSFLEIRTQVLQINFQSLNQDNLWIKSANQYLIYFDKK